MSGRGVRRTVLCLLVLAGPLAAPAPGAGAADPGVAVQEQPEADTTVTRVRVYENGSARWTVRIRTRLASEADVREYEAFQSEFRNNTSRFRDPFRERIGNVVAAGSRATGREMRATDFTASTSVQEVPRRWGVVTYEFTWTNFAASDGAALVVGDVFEGGFYIAENDTLTVAAPPGYAVETAAPAPDERGNGTVTWTGEQNFADGRPRARLAPADATGVPWSLVAGAALALVVLGAAGAGWYSRERRGAGGAAEIRTDEDRVRETLADNGGRMRQSELVEALGWSASKTSRVLSDMDEAGTVEKLRIGRENVVRLPNDED